MSDFLIHAARMQDAGVKHLTVTLGTADDRTRLMYVSADRDQPRHLRERFLTRTFELCGTDRRLERLKDDMLYSDGGPTKEAVLAAVKAYPLGAEDLAGWFADWLLCPPPTDDEVDAEEVNVSEADVERSFIRIKAMLQGLDIARQCDAMAAPQPKEPPDAASV